MAIKRTSKYLGKTYNNWTVVEIFVRAVQGKKCKYKKTLNARGNSVLADSKRPGHQSYTYVLERMTSDGKCDKRIAVNPQQMVAIARGFVDVEELADKHFGKRKTDYRFN